ncbi:MAG TPA: dihydrofolate reductase [Rhodocyclaceae bacterium]|nr:dihydrofolate reductase [Rhodocyclaceae bacterium]
MPKLTLVVAIAKNCVIGRDNQLPWHLPEDLAHFKAVTLGHPVLMGRKTWESLPPRFRPLPGRRNIVITRQAGYEAPGAEVASSVQAALALAGEHDVVCCIGGAEIFAATLPLADTLEVTEVDLEPEGDTWFPAISPSEWREAARETHVAQSGIGYAFVTYQRIP